jgi:hypothetical protein
VRGDREAGQARQRCHHQLIERLIGLVVALAQITHVVQDPDKDVRILIDAAICNRRFRAGSQLKVLSRAMAQEKDLEERGPLLHICVEIGEIRVVDDRLEGRTPPQPPADALGERGLSHPDVAGNQDQMFSHCHP